jgi:DUF1365 family protein
VPINTFNLTRVLIQYPLMTLQVFVAIYWQAFQVWRKRVPYVPHPKTCRVNSKNIHERREQINETNELKGEAVGQSYES